MLVTLIRSLTIDQSGIDDLTMHKFTSSNVLPVLWSQRTTYPSPRHPANSMMLCCVNCPGQCDGVEEERKRSDSQGFPS